MTDTLTPLDATFLELEQHDDVAHMHIGAASIFRPREDGSTPTLDELREHLEDRLAVVPRYRCRLSEPTTGGLQWPEWLPDEQFDMANHARHATLPAPGGESELCEWLGDYWSHRLDRHRPLWETVLLDGLEGGRWAIVSKTHHSMADGIGSLDAGSLVLDTSPQGDGGPAADRPLSARVGDEASARDARSRLEQLATALRWGPDQLLRTARAGADVAVHPGKAIDMLDRSRAALDVLVHDELIAAPPSSLNCEIGATRSFAVVRIPLADAKQVKGALGGTVNDFVLATVTGGLRQLLDSRGETPSHRGLRAMVPMNVREASDRLSLGNRISSLFVDLPVMADTPAERYRAVMASAEQLKSGHQALGTSSIIDLAGLAPPILHALIARSLYATRLFNVTITNVPGPQVALYALGCRLEQILPLVPLPADHALGVAIFSYDGTLFFGINAAANAVPDLEELRRGIELEADDLHRLATGVTARPRIRTGDQ